ncbi:hypothetical protein ACLMJK_004650 [Lecanora helva]
MEAEKLKKKLNGSTLKGSKMKVEDARPKKTTVEVADENAPPERKRRKSQTKEQGVIPGHELQDRKVKRGWTDENSKPSKGRKDKAGKKDSSMTGQEECLFKTSLPLNATSTEKTKDGKVKKRKRGDSSRDFLVHEFENTTKHAKFLRDGPDAEGKKPASEYIEGEGWMDEDGNLIEAVSKRHRQKMKLDAAAKTSSKNPEPRRSRRSSKLEAPSVEVTASKGLEKHNTTAEDETSSSGTSSDEEAHGPSLSAAPASPPKKTRSTRSKKSKNAQEETDKNTVNIDRLSITRSSTSPPPPASTSPPPTSAPNTSTNAVHPLESLFKRPQTPSSRSHTPKKPNLEVSTSFSFFDPDTEETNTGLTVPQTPFTQQDIRQRRQRSAAPTPDTAAPGKTFGDMWEGTSDIDEDGEDDDAGGDARQASSEATYGVGGKGGEGEVKEESEFSKWFWEHRGENNRAWKKRRREAMKEKRQRERKERYG